jgi:hypothetical protein
MAWNTDTQFGPTPAAAGVCVECGSYALSADEVDAGSLSIPTKLARIRGGHGVTSDGLPCTPALGLTSNGVVVFTRHGTPLTGTPTIYYTLYGY